MDNNTKKRRNDSVTSSRTRPVRSAAVQSGRRTHETLNELSMMDNTESSTYNDNNEPVYCICRNAFSGQQMIQCDSCDDWFHLECVGLTPQQAETIDNYVCEERCQGGNLKKNRKRSNRDEDVSNPTDNNNNNPNNLHKNHHNSQASPPTHLTTHSSPLETNNLEGNDELVYEGNSHELVYEGNPHEGHLFNSTLQNAGPAPNSQFPQSQRMHPFSLPNSEGGVANRDVNAFSQFNYPFKSGFINDIDTSNPQFNEDNLPKSETTFNRPHYDQYDPNAHKRVNNILNNINLNMNLPSHLAEGPDAEKLALVGHTGFGEHSSVHALGLSDPNLLISNLPLASSPDHLSLDPLDLPAHFPLSSQNQTYSSQNQTYQGEGDSEHDHLNSQTRTVYNQLIMSLGLNASGTQKQGHEMSGNNESQNVQLNSVPSYPLIPPRQTITNTHTHIHTHTSHTPHTPAATLHTSQPVEAVEAGLSENVAVNTDTRTTESGGVSTGGVDMSTELLDNVYESGTGHHVSTRCDSTGVTRVHTITRPVDFEVEYKYDANDHSKLYCAGLKHLKQKNEEVVDKQRKELILQHKELILQRKQLQQRHLGRPLGPDVKIDFDEKIDFDDPSDALLGISSDLMIDPAVNPHTRLLPDRCYVAMTTRSDALHREYDGDDDRRERGDRERERDRERDRDRTGRERSVDGLADRVLESDADGEDKGEIEASRSRDRDREVDAIGLGQIGRRDPRDLRRERDGVDDATERDKAEQDVLMLQYPVHPTNVPLPPSHIPISDVRPLHSMKEFASHRADVDQKSLGTLAALSAASAQTNPIWTAEWENDPAAEWDDAAYDSDDVNGLYEDDMDVPQDLAGTDVGLKMCGFNVFNEVSHTDSLLDAAINQFQQPAPKFRETSTERWNREGMIAPLVNSSALLTQTAMNKIHSSSHRNDPNSVMVVDADDVVPRLLTDPLYKDESDSAKSGKKSLKYNPRRRRDLDITGSIYNPDEDDVHAVMRYELRNLRAAVKQYYLLLHRSNSLPSPPSPPESAAVTAYLANRGKLPVTESIPADSMRIGGVIVKKDDPLVLDVIFNSNSKVRSLKSSNQLPDSLPHTDNTIITKNELPSIENDLDGFLAHDNVTFPSSINTTRSDFANTNARNARRIFAETGVPPVSASETRPSASDPSLPSVSGTGRQSYEAWLREGNVTLSFCNDRRDMFGEMLNDTYGAEEVPPSITISGSDSKCGNASDFSKNLSLLIACSNDGIFSPSDPSQPSSLSTDARVSLAEQLKGLDKVQDVVSAVVSGGVAYDEVVAMVDATVQHNIRQDVKSFQNICNAVSLHRASGLSVAKKPKSKSKSKSGKSVKGVVSHGEVAGHSISHRNAHLTEAVRKSRELYGFHVAQLGGTGVAAVITVIAKTVRDVVMANTPVHRLPRGLQSKKAKAKTLSVASAINKMKDQVVQIYKKLFPSSSSSEQPSVFLPDVVNPSLTSSSLGAGVASTSFNNSLFARYQEAVSSLVSLAVLRQKQDEQFEKYRAQNTVTATMQQHQRQSIGLAVQALYRSYVRGIEAYYNAACAFAQQKQLVQEGVEVTARRLTKEEKKITLRKKHQAQSVINDLSLSHTPSTHLSDSVLSSLTTAPKPYLPLHSVDSASVSDSHSTDSPPTLTASLSHTPSLSLHESKSLDESESMSDSVHDSVHDSSDSNSTLNHNSLVDLSCTLPEFDLPWCKCGRFACQVSKAFVKRTERVRRILAYMQEKSQQIRAETYEKYCQDWQLYYQHYLDKYTASMPQLVDTLKALPSDIVTEEIVKTLHLHPCIPPDLFPYPPVSLETGDLVKIPTFSPPPVPPHFTHSRSFSHNGDVSEMAALADTVTPSPSLLFLLGDADFGFFREPATTLMETLYRLIVAVSSGVYGDVGLDETSFTYTPESHSDSSSDSSSGNGCEGGDLSEVMNDVLTGNHHTHSHSHSHPTESHCFTKPGGRVPVTSALILASLQRQLANTKRDNATERGITPGVIGDVVDFGSRMYHNHLQHRLQPLALSQSPTSTSESSPASDMNDSQTSLNSEQHSKSANSALVPCMLLTLRRLIRSVLQASLRANTADTSSLTSLKKLVQTAKSTLISLENSHLSHSHSHSSTNSKSLQTKPSKPSECERAMAYPPAALLLHSLLTRCGYIPANMSNSNYGNGIRLCDVPESYTAALTMSFDHNIINKVVKFVKRNVKTTLASGHLPSNSSDVAQRMADIGQRIADLGRRIVQLDVIFNSSSTPSSTPSSTSIHDRVGELLLDLDSIRTSLSHSLSQNEEASQQESTQAVSLSQTEQDTVALLNTLETQLRSRLQSLSVADSQSHVPHLLVLTLAQLLNLASGKPNTHNPNTHKSRKSRWVKKAAQKAAKVTSNAALIASLSTSPSTLPSSLLHSVPVTLQTFVDLQCNGADDLYLAHYLASLSHNVKRVQRAKQYVVKLASTLSTMAKMTVLTQPIRHCKNYLNTHINKHRLSRSQNKLNTGNTDKPRECTFVNTVLYSSAVHELNNTYSHSNGQILTSDPLNIMTTEPYSTLCLNKYQPNLLYIPSSLLHHDLVLRETALFPSPSDRLHANSNESESECATRTQDVKNILQTVLQHAELASSQCNPISNDPHTVDHTTYNPPQNTQHPQMYEDNIFENAHLLSPEDQNLLHQHQLRLDQQQHEQRQDFEETFQLQKHQEQQLAAQQKAEHDGLFQQHYMQQQLVLQEQEKITQQNPPLDEQQMREFEHLIQQHVEGLLQNQHAEKEHLLAEHLRLQQHLKSVHEEQLNYKLREYHMMNMEVEKAMQAIVQNGLPAANKPVINVPISPQMDDSSPSSPLSPPITPIPLPLPPNLSHADADFFIGDVEEPRDMKMDMDMGAQQTTQHTAQHTNKHTTQHTTQHTAQDIHSVHTIHPHQTQTEQTNQGQTNQGQLESGGLEVKQGVEVNVSAPLGHSLDSQIDSQMNDEVSMNDASQNLNQNPAGETTQSSASTQSTQLDQSTQSAESLSSHRPVERSVESVFPFTSPSPSLASSLFLSFHEGLASYDYLIRRYYSEYLPDHDASKPLAPPDRDDGKDQKSIFSSLSPSPLSPTPSHITMSSNLSASSLNISQNSTNKSTEKHSQNPSSDKALNTDKILNNKTYEICRILSSPSPDTSNDTSNPELFTSLSAALSDPSLSVDPTHSATNAHTNLDRDIVFTGDLGAIHLQTETALRLNNLKNQQPTPPTSLAQYYAPLKTDSLAFTSSSLHNSREELDETVPRNTEELTHEIDLHEQRCHAEQDLVKTAVHQIRMQMQSTSVRLEELVVEQNSLQTSLQALLNTNSLLMNLADQSGLRGAEKEEAINSLQSSLATCNHNVEMCRAHIQELQQYLLDLEQHAFYLRNEYSHLFTRHLHLLSNSTNLATRRALENLHHLTTDGLAARFSPELTRDVINHVNGIPLPFFTQEFTTSVGYVTSDIPDGIDSNSNPASLSSSLRLKIYSDLDRLDPTRMNGLLDRMRMDAEWYHNSVVMNTLDQANLQMLRMYHPQATLEHLHAQFNSELTNLAFIYPHANHVDLHPSHPVHTTHLHSTPESEEDGGQTSCGDEGETLQSLQNLTLRYDTTQYRPSTHPTSRASHSRSQSRVETTTASTSTSDPQTTTTTSVGVNSVNVNMVNPVNINMVNSVNVNMGMNNESSNQSSMSNESSMTDDPSLPPHSHSQPKTTSSTDSLPPILPPPQQTNITLRHMDTIGWVHAVQLSYLSQRILLALHTKRRTLDSLKSHRLRIRAVLYMISQAELHSSSEPAVHYASLGDDVSLLDALQARLPHTHLVSDLVPGQKPGNTSGESDGTTPNSHSTSSQMTDQNTDQNMDSGDRKRKRVYSSEDAYQEGVESSEEQQRPVKTAKTDHLLPSDSLTSPLALVSVSNIGVSDSMVEPTSPSTSTVEPTTTKHSLTDLPLNRLNRPKPARVNPTVVPSSQFNVDTLIKSTLTTDSSSHLTSDGVSTRPVRLTTDLQSDDLQSSPSNPVDCVKTVSSSVSNSTKRSVQSLIEKALANRANRSSGSNTSGSNNVSDVSPTNHPSSDLSLDSLHSLKLSSDNIKCSCGGYIPVSHFASHLISCAVQRSPAPLSAPLCPVNDEDSMLFQDSAGLSFPNRSGANGTGGSNRVGGAGDWGSKRLDWYAAALNSDCNVCGYPLNGTDLSGGVCLRTRLSCKDHILWEEVASAEIAYYTALYTQRLRGLTVRVEAYERRMNDRQITNLNAMFHSIHVLNETSVPSTALTHTVSGPNGSILNNLLVPCKEQIPDSTLLSTFHCPSHLTTSEMSDDKTLSDKTLSKSAKRELLKKKLNTQKKLDLKLGSKTESDKSGESGESSISNSIHHLLETRSRVFNSSLLLNKLTQLSNPSQTSLHSSPTDASALKYRYGLEDLYGVANNEISIPALQHRTLHTLHQQRLKMLAETNPDAENNPENLDLEANFHLLDINQLFHTVNTEVPNSVFTVGITEDANGVFLSPDGTVLSLAVDIDSLRSYNQTFNISIANDVEVGNKAAEVINTHAILQVLQSVPIPPYNPPSTARIAVKPLDSLPALPPVEPSAPVHPLAVEQLDSANHHSPASTLHAGAHSPPPELLPPTEPSLLPPPTSRSLSQTQTQTSPSEPELHPPSQCRSRSLLESQSQSEEAMVDHVETGANQSLTSSSDSHSDLNLDTVNFAVCQDPAVHTASGVTHLAVFPTVYSKNKINTELLSTSMYNFTLSASSTDPLLSNLISAATGEPMTMLERGDPVLLLQSLINATRSAENLPVSYSMTLSLIDYFINYLRALPHADDYSYVPNLSLPENEPISDSPTDQPPEPFIITFPDSHENVPSEPPLESIELDSTEFPTPFSEADLQILHAFKNTDHSQLLSLPPSSTRTLAANNTVHLTEDLLHPINISLSLCHPSRLELLLFKQKQQELLTHFFNLENRRVDVRIVAETKPVLNLASLDSEEPSFSPDEQLSAVHRPIHILSRHPKVDLFTLPLTEQVRLCREVLQVNDYYISNFHTILLHCTESFSPHAVSELITHYHLSLPASHQEQENYHINRHINLFKTLNQLDYSPSPEAANAQISEFLASTGPSVAPVTPAVMDQFLTRPDTHELGSMVGHITPLGSMLGDIAPSEWIQLHSSFQNLFTSAQELAGNFKNLPEPTVKQFICETLALPHEIDPEFVLTEGHLELTDIINSINTYIGTIIQTTYAVASKLFRTGLCLANVLLYNDAEFNATVGIALKAISIHVKNRLLALCNTDVKPPSQTLHPDIEDPEIARLELELRERQTHLIRLAKKFSTNIIDLTAPVIHDIQDSHEDSVFLTAFFRDTTFLTDSLVFENILAIDRERRSLIRALYMIILLHEHWNNVPPYIILQLTNSAEHSMVKDVRARLEGLGDEHNVLYTLWKDPKQPIVSVIRDWQTSNMEKNRRTEVMHEAHNREIQLAIQREEEAIEREKQVREREKEALEREKKEALEREKKEKKARALQLAQEREEKARKEEAARQEELEREKERERERERVRERERKEKKEREEKEMREKKSDLPRSPDHAHRSEPTNVPHNSNPTSASTKNAKAAKSHEHSNSSSQTAQSHTRSHSTDRREKTRTEAKTDSAKKTSELSGNSTETDTSTETPVEHLSAQQLEQCQTDQHESELLALRVVQELQMASDSCIPLPVPFVLCFTHPTLQVDSHFDQIAHQTSQSYSQVMESIRAEAENSNNANIELTLDQQKHISQLIFSQEATLVQQKLEFFEKEFKLQSSNRDVIKEIYAGLNFSKLNTDVILQEITNALLKPDLDPLPVRNFTSSQQFMEDFTHQNLHHVANCEITPVEADLNEYALRYTDAIIKFVEDMVKLLETYHQLFSLQEHTLSKTFQTLSAWRPPDESVDPDLAREIQLAQDFKETHYKANERKLFYLRLWLVLRAGQHLISQTHTAFNECRNQTLAAFQHGLMNIDIAAHEAEIDSAFNELKSILESRQIEVSQKANSVLAMIDKIISIGMIREATIHETLLNRQQSLQRDHLHRHANMIHHKQLQYQQYAQQQQDLSNEHDHFQHQVQSSSQSSTSDQHDYLFESADQYPQYSQNSSQTQTASQTPVQTSRTPNQTPVQNHHQSHHQTTPVTYNQTRSSQKASDKDSENKKAAEAAISHLTNNPTTDEQLQQYQLMQYQHLLQQQQHYNQLTQQYQQQYGQQFMHYDQQNQHYDPQNQQGQQSQAYDHTQNQQNQGAYEQFNQQNQGTYDQQLHAQQLQLEQYNQYQQYQQQLEYNQHHNHNQQSYDPQSQQYDHNQHQRHQK